MQDHTALARLRHDVAKYIVRVAQNVDDEVPVALVPLLLGDVYGACAPYQRDRVHLSEGARKVCDEAFDALERVEEAARSGEPEALRVLLQYARTIARAIEGEP